MPRRKKSGQAQFSNNISIWHKNIPILYDTIYQTKLSCPSYSCTFGHLLPSSPSDPKNFSKYRLFQSHATNANYLKDKHIWQGLPHSLLICDVYLPNNDNGNNNNPHSNNTLYHQLNAWNTHCNNNNDNNDDIISYPLQNNANKPYFEVIKRIIHPGPILRIKQMYTLPQIVATHTQHKYVFIWNTSTQHDREMINNSDPNTPELILKGHKKDAVHALDFSHNDYGVASGSKDHRICIWNICDYQTVLSSNNEPDKTERFVPLSKPSPKLKPRMILKGHTAEVTDVEFAPYSSYLIASVSCDKSFKLWDIRCNQKYDIYKDGKNNNSTNNTFEIDNNFIASINGLHNTEITNLSWNSYNNNYILTASKDGDIKLLDIRKFSQSSSNTSSSQCVIKEFHGHSKKISSLEWNPSKGNSDYFLSSSHDGSVNIWNINKSYDNKDDEQKSNNLIFKHIGHMNHYQGSEVIHSASWIKSNNNSWCIASTSSPKPFVPFFWSSSSDNNKDIVMSGNENPNDISEGGIMQIWKPSMLLKMDRKDIFKHLKQRKGKKFVDDIDSKKNKKKKKKKDKNGKNGKLETTVIVDDNEDIDIKMTENVNQ